MSKIGCVPEKVKIKLNHQRSKIFLALMDETHPVPNEHYFKTDN